ncbi:MAG: hypothetical protein GY727_00535 [Gammaproteobacteria bacterium]|nr:hypothetical protein [Gammaproteobacteria bacterium]
MDLQPLLVIITGEGHLHGFTHTYVGATVVALISAVGGKYLSQFGLGVLGLSKDHPIPVLSNQKIRATIPKEKAIEIFWRVAFLSAFVGSYCHLFLDSIMHADIEPLYPIHLFNQFYGLVSISMLHNICIYSGLFGAILFYVVSWYRNLHRHKSVESGE